MQRRPPSTTVTALMPHGLGKEIDHDHPGDDQRKSDDGGQIQALLEDHPADEGDEDDAQATPDRIGDADRHHLEHQAQKIEGDRIEEEDGQAWEKPGELLRRLEEGGADRLEQNCQRQIDVDQGTTFQNRMTRKRQLEAKGAASTSAIAPTAWKEKRGSGSAGAYTPSYLTADPDYLDPLCKPL